MAEINKCTGYLSRQVVVRYVCLWKTQRQLYLMENRGFNRNPQIQLWISLWISLCIQWIETLKSADLIKIYGFRPENPRIVRQKLHQFQAGSEVCPF